MEIAGYCHPPKSAEKVPATLVCMPGGRVQLRYLDKTVNSSVSELDSGPDIGNLPLVLRFPGGESFLPGEEEQKLKCWLVHQKPPGLVGRLERNWKGIFASTVLTVFVVVLFFTYGIPAITNGIVRVMPAKIPKLVGQEVTASLDEHIFESSELSDDKREAITLRFDALVAQIDPLPFTPKLEFRRWGNGPNAFALSDGTVIVLDSLVKLSGISPRLDAILLHELGHIEHQHVMKSLVRSSLLSAGVAVITGESTGLLDTLAVSAFL